MRNSGAIGAVNVPLRVGVVGLGAISQVAHLPVLTKMRGVQVAALCDNDAAKARALAQRFGVSDIFTDIDDLLADAALDAVVLATPNHLHEPHILAALRAGVHVMCERPLALGARGVERILAAARKSERTVFVANNHRFRSDVQTLAGFLRGNELGRITAIRCGSYRVHGDMAPWRLRRAEAGGGAFLELGLPLLDLALWMADFPAVERVSAQMERARGASTVEQSMMVGLSCDGGLSIGVDVRWDYVGSGDLWWCNVIGTKGSARLNPLRIVKAINGKPTNVSPSGAAARETAFLQSYRAELAHFVAVLRGDAPYEAPDDQLAVYRMMETIYKAAEDEKEVRL